MPTYPTYKLGDVAEIILGQSPESKSYNTKGEGLPFFQGKSEFTDWFPVPNKWCTEPKKIAEPLDILLSVRAPVGPTNVAKEKCCIGRGLAAIRYPECYKYVLYYLRSVSKHLESKATGTTFSSISGDVIRNLSIPLPPLPTQHQIVSRIESIFAELDKAVEHLRTAQQQLKIYRQAVLNHWLNNDDGKWEMVKLGEVAEVKRGRSKHRPRNDKSLFGGKYPFIQTGEIREAKGGTISTYSQTYSEKGLEQSRLWPKGTLCLTIAANIAETAYLGFDACFPDSVVGIIARQDRLNLDYFNCYIQLIKQMIEQQASATAQKNINVDYLDNLQIPLPPLPEQQRIVEEIETPLSQAEAAEARIAEALQKTEALRQSILKKAFSGEFDL